MKLLEKIHLNLIKEPIIDFLNYKLDNKDNIIFLNNNMINISNINIESNILYFIKYINFTKSSELWYELFHFTTQSVIHYNKKHVFELLKHSYIKIKYKDLLIIKINGLSSTIPFVVLKNKKILVINALNVLIKILLTDFDINDFINVKDDKGNNILYYCELYELNEIVEIIKNKKACLKEN